MKSRSRVIPVLSILAFFTFNTAFAATTDTVTPGMEQPQVTQPQKMDAGGDKSTQMSSQESKGISKKQDNLKKHKAGKNTKSTAKTKGKTGKKQAKASKTNKSNKSKKASNLS